MDLIFNMDLVFWILSELSRKGSGFSGIVSVEVRYKFLGVFKLCGW